MSKQQMQRVFTGLLVAALVITSAASLALAAPMGQTVRSQTVEGTIPGGQFAKIWLGLETQTLGQPLTVTAEWDRSDLSGIGFYILDAEDVAAVLGGEQPRTNNVATGTSVPAFRGPANMQAATLNATAAGYTLVVYNDSAQDAGFTINAQNAYIVDESGNVSDANAAPAATDAAPAATASVTTTATTTATTPPVVTATTPTTPTTPAAVAVTAPATATGTAAVVSPGVVEATTLEGELPNKDDQHYLGLKPTIKDGTVRLSLTFDPQDNAELARRLNFWVLDDVGFKAYQSGSRLSTVAIAAGSSTVQTAANQREATFKSAGFGPYTVIVYNSSAVPATYQLTATDALLIDDSGQTLTAQAASTATTSVAAPAPGVTTTVTTTATTPAAAPAAAAAPARDARPGGTYTVRAGDTLALIAQDVYGDYRLYEQLCALNGIADCNRIEIGDVIRLPAQAELGTVSTAAPAAAPAARPTPAATTAVTGTTAVTPTAPITRTGTLTATAGTTATTGTAAAQNNVVDALIARGNFKALLAALDAAGLVDTLEGDGPYTLFAPTDAAFAKLPQGAVAELLANPSGQLTQILLFHVASGEVMSEDITNGMEVQMLQGNSAKLETTADGVAINGANISAADVPASNGVIHVIDAVILPPLPQ